MWKFFLLLSLFFLFNSQPSSHFPSIQSVIDSLSSGDHQQLLKIIDQVDSSSQNCFSKQLYLQCIKGKIEDFQSLQQNSNAKNPALEEAMSLLNDLQKKLDQLESKIKFCQSKIEKYEKIDEILKKMEMGQASISQLKFLLSSLMQLLTGQNSMELISKMKKLQNLIRSMSLSENKIENNRKRIKQLEDLLFELNRRFNEGEFYESQSQRLTQSIIRLRQEIEEEESKFEELKEQMKDLGQCIRRIIGDMLNEKIQKKEEEIDSNKEKMEKIIKEIEQINARLRNLQKASLKPEDFYELIQRTIFNCESSNTVLVSTPKSLSTFLRISLEKFNTFSKSAFGPSSQLLKFYNENPPPFVLLKSRGIYSKQWEQEYGKVASTFDECCQTDTTLEQSYFLHFSVKGTIENISKKEIKVNTQSGRKYTIRLTACSRIYEAIFQSNNFNRIQAKVFIPENQQNSGIFLQVALIFEKPIPKVTINDASALKRFSSTFNIPL